MLMARDRPELFTLNLSRRFRGFPSTKGMNNFRALSAVLIGGALLVPNLGFASSFTINNSTSTSAQSLSSNQTGTITSTGTLNVSGSSVAVTFTGTGTLTNNGLLEQTGSGRAIRDNTGNINVTVANTGTIESNGDDTYQENKAGSTVSLTNSGIIEALGTGSSNGQAIDWAALNTNTGTNTLINTGTITAADSDAIRPGQNGTIKNDGLIKSSTIGDSGNDAIDGQNNTNLTIINAVANVSTNANTIEGARHGITDGDGTHNVTLSVTNNSFGTIKGDNGSGINIDGFATNGVTTETVTVNNAGVIQGNGNTVLSGETTADGDGVDVDGLVIISNTGTIVSKNAVGNSGTLEKSEGITVGGGTITNSGLIEGDVTNTTTQFAVGRGITLAGVDKDSNGNPIPTQSIYADSTITNQAGGKIIGGDDAAIAVEGTGTWTAHTVTINNNAGGDIEGNYSSATEGGGTSVAAIEGGVTATNSTAVTNSIIVNNAGTINGNTSGKAIDFGNGSANSLTITGGVAQVLGNISGGTGTTTINITPGSGQSFGYKGTISGNSTVNVTAGTFTVGGPQTGSSASGKVVLNTAQFTGGTGSNTHADLNVANANLTFALGASDSNTQIQLTGGVNTTVTFNNATASFQDLDGGSLDAGHEYVLIDGDGANTTYTGLTFGATNSYGELITGGLTISLPGGDDFSNNYSGSQLYYDSLNGDIDLVLAAPEPGAWALGLIAMGGIVALRLRRGARA